MALPVKITGLIELFERNIDAYKSGHYNETEVRHEFIDPLFITLGWDVNNEQGYAEAFKDVIHEDSIKVGGVPKAPDYCFRIGGTRKFFLEAKKPSVNIKEETHPAYQLRRYAWSAKLPLSILTDFEEFAVYDCRIKPVMTDKSSTARVFYSTFQDYPQHWDWIASVFSKDAILKGSFDKYIESSRAKKGTAEVDRAFLREIESWRDSLARIIALRNTSLTRRELNFAVQRTIDRVIFLRICEDRGIEDYGALMQLLNGSNVYRRLCDIYHRADERYNSGLFHFRTEKGFAEPPDEMTLSLVIDDKPLKDIIKNLYYPDSPYEFSVLPADILGQVYEQFLGKVIRLTTGHRAVVEDKPEVKKAGGVYYTPTYIVDYIVENTVGKLLDGKKTPDEASRLKILDPACGSGSFLIGAYQYLLDWHLRRYTENNPEKWAKARKPRLYRGPSGDWRLTTDERKRILLNTIYGVDIDPQAVEVTKLSLLLKVLEGESGQTLSMQYKLFHERALPNLGDNIKCGNSLIGPDFYDGKQMDLFDEEERYRINVFDWNAEFPEIMKVGGFDAVIGNPPYVRIQGFPRVQIEYLTKHYHSATGNYDLYVSFVERGFKLLGKDGHLGFIIPNKFFRTDYGMGLRTLLTDNECVYEVVNFGAEQVFDATTYTCLLFLSNQPNTIIRYSEVKARSEYLQAINFSTRDISTLRGAAWTFTSEQTSSLIEKLHQKSIRLLDLPAKMSRGSSTGDDKVFVFEASKTNVESEMLREPVFASDFGRYKFEPSGKWRVIFPYVFESGEYRLLFEAEIRKKYPRTFDYFVTKQAVLKKRKQFKSWYGFSAARNLILHDRAQIIIPLLADRGLFALIPDNSHGKLCPMASGGFTITILEDCPVKKEYVLGLLNSQLIFWCLKQMSNIFRGGWITCTKQYFGELPIRTINFSDPADKSRHDSMVSLVESMLVLHKQLAEAKTAHEKVVIQRQIDATDRQIDNLVYELYGLKEEEIRIVEAP